MGPRGVLRVVPAPPVRVAPTNSELVREICKAYSKVRGQLLQLKYWGTAVQDEHGVWWLRVRDTAALKRQRSECSSKSRSRQRHQQERVLNLAKLVGEGSVEMSD